MSVIWYLSTCFTKIKALKVLLGSIALRRLAIRIMGEYQH